MTSNYPIPASDGLLDGILELVWPTRCLGCEKPGVLLCEECALKLPFIEQTTACPRCGAPYGQLICTECYDRTGPIPLSFSAAVCAFSFDETVARLIKGYKDQGERRLAAPLALVLVQALPESWYEWADAFTFIPAGHRAYRKRGFDHMEEIATHVASSTGLEMLRLLEKTEADDQRPLGREQRFQNLEGAFRVLPHTQRLLNTTPAPLSPAPLTTAPFTTAPLSSPSLNLLLIDDVLTTGATLDAASNALISAGAGDIRVATVARVW